MLGRQTEKHLGFTVVDQPDRQVSAGGLSQNDLSASQPRQRRRRSEARKPLKAVSKWITIAPRTIEEFGTHPVFSEFTKPRRRLTTVCAWCKGTKNAKGSWSHAEHGPKTDAASRVSHGICPECAEKSYNELRLAAFAASFASPVAA
jgi:hypothetical protein